MTELLARGPSNPTEELRIELYEKVNALGIGAQGLGGLATVLDIKIKDWPTHAASKPVAMIPNCAATRHAHVTLDGSGPAYLEKPVLADYPQIDWAPDSAAKRVDLDTLTPEVVASWKQGDRILLNGKMLTGRDAAHKRIADMLAKGEELPVEFKGRVIYYVGPVDPVGEEIVGPAGPTTATRMDKFMDMMLEQGLLACVGKAERGPAATQAIAKHKSARRSSASPTSAWRRSTNSRSRTSPSPSRSIAKARTSTSTRRKSGKSGSTTKGCLRKPNHQRLLFRSRHPSECRGLAGASLPSPPI